ncbi:hypothetical protein QTP70_021264 [Hemibagrus guttatus]|uniref:Reverse transcriptase domain-containing protein n=1 Tax=Hemibagrus guttatus TaxID=175788 RepID=A0AAE0RBP5_9TELE|nr:hypothetical protein QTP70_021264 [Hemibagrus guttatus]
MEMIVDFRKDPAPLPPVILCDSLVTSAESFRFLGTTITKELKWEQNIRSLTKKAQQRMYFLRQLKKFLLPVKMLVNFYTAIIESILTSSITVWFAIPPAKEISSLSDYRAVALPPVVMCFKKLVWSHIASLLLPSFDSYQFAYRGNRFTEDAVATALHAALSHLEKQGSYVWMLFVDYSSAFNTILPYILVDKLEDLGLPNSTCMWINSFLSDCSQRVRVGRHIYVC